ERQKNLTKKIQKTGKKQTHKHHPTTRRAASKTKICSLPFKKMAPNNPPTHYRVLKEHTPTNTTHTGRTPMSQFYFQNCHPRSGNFSRLPAMFRGRKSRLPASGYIPEYDSPHVEGRH
ncbi:hypothetical protein ACWDPV_17560, partial [Gordonia sp. NPDC003504]